MAAWRGFGRTARNGAYPESAQYTFEATLKFSYLTRRVYGRIVDAAVRVEPGWQAGASAPLQNIESDPHHQPEIELSVQMGQTSVKPADRRQTPRTKLVEIAYIGMGPENGGLVLDVSDGGLSFHAVAPVKPAETIHFLLSLRGHSRIEGAGEVVWANELRTICGLRFTSLSAGAREHLNNWTTQSRMPAAARAKPVSSAPPAPPQTEESPASLASQSATNSAPVFAIACSASAVSINK